MDARRLARIAYYKLIDDIAEIQQRLALQRMVRKMFADDALPIGGVYRGRIGVLADSAEAVRREEEASLERLAEYTEAAKAMEEVFREKEDADMESFAAYFAERFRKGEE